ncbi:MAG TPA: PEP/pyruvate-binding domain-containing protein [Thermomicrobiales bacterium]|nr:PEP/pyruvate-binding domain-containing protein [Thermomicrobiales bacterium]
MLVSPYVCSLDGGSHLTERIGGKAASLSRLRALEAPVPAAFAVTTEAYRLHARQLGIPDRASMVSDAELPIIRERITAAPIPLEIAGAIAAELAGIGAGAVLAVRSSATTEDSPAFSFAGLHDTALAVENRPDAVEAAIKRCWASLWSERSVDYRRRGGAALDTAAMAVVVQQLVRSDVSFVAFSVDPINLCAPRIIISASYGLGEAIVAGLVVPDYIVLSPDGEIEDYQIGSKETMVIAAADGVGVAEVKVPRFMAAQPALSHEHARQIGRMITQLERQFGRPLDIEGGIADGAVVLFQARPITTCSAHV